MEKLDGGYKWGSTSNEVTPKEFVYKWVELPTGKQILVAYDTVTNEPHIEDLEAIKQLGFTLKQIYQLAVDQLSK